MFAISPTDNNWFEFLKEKNFTEVINFWTPSPWNISRLKTGDKLFFMLKAPIRKLGGYGVFVDYHNLSLEDAWTKFGYRNGCPSKSDFINRLRKYKKGDIDPKSYEIGCIILKNCVYWEPGAYKIPDNYGISFSPSIVKIKYYELEDIFTEDDMIEALSPFKLIFNPDDHNSKMVLVKQRVGQSNFKSIISKIYENHCCITGTICPELLEAAHIQRSNHFQNGLLLRVDFTGYLIMVSYISTMTIKFTLVH